MAWQGIGWKGSNFPTNRPEPSLFIAQEVMVGAGCHQIRRSFLVRWRGEGAGNIPNIYVCDLPPPFGVKRREGVLYAKFCGLG